MVRRTILSVIGAIALGSTAAPLHAQEVTTEEIIQQLRPSGKTRSLSENRGIKVEGTDLVETESSINLYINFDYNSAALRQDGLITLDKLAAALKDERLSSLDFLIGGHTDAKGGDAFNLGLSERRAEAVKDYLVQRHGVDTRKLIEKGFGESRLLDPARPLEGVNRRVQGGKRPLLRAKLRELREALELLQLYDRH